MSATKACSRLTGRQNQSESFPLLCTAVMLCMTRKGERLLRITINLPEKLGDSLKRTALQERISVSRLVTGAVENYRLEKRRRASGKKVLDLAGRMRGREERMTGSICQKRRRPATVGMRQIRITVGTLEARLLYRISSSE
jgi:hypothetical protein